MNAVFQKNCSGYDHIKGSSTPLYDEDPTILEKTISQNFSPHKSVSFGHVDINWINELGLIPRPYYESCFKFAFVRNPWDRMVSLYRHRIEIIHEILPDFNTWIRKHVNQDLPPVGPYNVKGLSQANCQLNWIPDDINFVGRYERIQNDFDYVCGQIGVEKKRLPNNMKTSHRPYYEYYDRESVEIVAHKHQADIEKFGYSFKHKSFL